jgi:hypothetical protein
MNWNRLHDPSDVISIVGGSKPTGRRLDGGAEHAEARITSNNVAEW